MKYYNYILLFLSFGLILFLGVFLLSSKEAVDVSEQRPYVLSRTNSVPIPSHVEFCGQRISLDRLDMRERFDREITGFTYLHSTTLLYFKRANRFFPVIEPILKKNGIPDDFKYLCLIESNLDIRALSVAKAAGLWQFMESTGKSYGLEITSQIDERYHIEKATEAACRYFKDAYARYGDWVNVAASYNAGMGRISSSMQSQMVDSAFDLLLVSETSRYVFRIMAAKQIFEHPSRYGFVLKKEDFYQHVPVRYITVDSSISDLAVFAKEHEINYMQLKEFNPWLRDTSLTSKAGKSYRIAIPEKEYLFFNKNRLKVHDDRWLE